MQNVKIGGDFGQLGVAQGHWQPYHSIECIRLPVQLYRKLCIYLVLFSHYSKLFVESHQV